MRTRQFPPIVEKAPHEIKRNSLTPSDNLLTPSVTAATSDVRHSADTATADYAPDGQDRQATPAPARGNKVTYDADRQGLRLPGHGSGRPRLRLQLPAQVGRTGAPVSPSAATPIGASAAAREEAKRSSARSTAVRTRSASIGHSRGAATVADLCARFRKDHLPRVRAATQRDYRQQIRVDILPALGRMKVAAVNHADVDALHRKISARAPTHANRGRGGAVEDVSVSRALGLAQRQPLQEASSATKSKRQRYLSGAEMARLTGPWPSCATRAPPTPCGCCC